MKNSKNIKLFGLFNIFESFDFLAPIRIVYFQQATHSYTLAASLISIIWISSALLEVPTGIFSDFIGRKKTIIWGAISISLAYVLYALGFGNYWVLALGAFLQGASRAFYSGNNDAYLYDLVDEKEKETKFPAFYGRIYSLLSFSALVTALLSGVLAGWSFSLMICLSAIPQFFSLFVAILLPEVKVIKSETSNIYTHLKDSFKEIKGNINLRYLSLASIFGGAGSAAYEFHAAVFSAVWPLWAIGIARALQELTCTVSYYFSDKIIKKFGALNTSIFQTIFSWLGSVVAVIVRSIASPFFIISGFILLGASDTASQTLQQKEFTDKQRATIASLNSLGSSLYFTFVMYIAGLIANRYDAFMGLLTTQIFFIPVIYYRLKLFFHIRKTQTI